MKINAALAQDLVRDQFPQWADLPISPVAKSGWDNRTFHLGDQMSLRLPSDAGYAPQVDKEQRWLPKLAPHLPLEIPTPVAMGEAGCGYPWNWSVYRWIEGDTAAAERIVDMDQFANALAGFMTSLHTIDTTGGPPAGTHNFFRGGPLATYQAEVEQAISILGDGIDRTNLRKIWETAIATEWQGKPVWVHGDVATGNLVVRGGQLTAVIDFGCLGVGDPACDLVIAWTFFDIQARNTFRAALSLDEQTWERARGWALWKALIVTAQLPGTNPAERENAQRTMDELIADEGPYEPARLTPKPQAPQP